MNSIIPIEIEIRNESRNKKNLAPPPPSQMPHQQHKINRQFNDQHINSRHSTNTYTEHNSNTIFKSSNHHQHQNNIVQNLSPIKPSFVK